MAQSQQKKPNILILWGDDIGMWNVSRYSQGMMGYRTPNIDRIGEEGATFTDWYASRAAPPAARPSYRPEPDPHGPDQGRHARRRRRPSEGRPDHC